jgi:putative PEP-CTERM system TPR-repeat lipoprotein
MSYKSSLMKSAMLIGVVGLTASGLPSAALADNPPQKLRPAPHADPEVERLRIAAIQAMRQGNVSLATIQFKNALRIDPGNGTLRAQLALALLEGSDPVSAEREARQARLDGAKDQDVVPVLLQAMLVHREYADILAQFPDPAPTDKSKLALAILRSRAESLQSTGDGPGATLAADRSLAIQRDASGLMLRARIALLQNQSDAAMSFINQALAMTPNNSAALMMKASVMRAKDPKGALALVSSIVQAHPDDVNAIIARAELLIDAGQNDEAGKTIDTLIAKAPNLPIANFYKAVLLGMAKKYQDGWRIAQSLPPEFVQSSERVVVAVAMLAANAGNNESANSLLTTYLGQHNEALEPRIRLAALRLRMNNPAYALEVLKPVMDSQNPAVLQLISAAYAQAKQPDRALEYMRKAKAAGSKNPIIASELAIQDLTANNTAQGMQQVMDLLKQQPGQINTAAAAVSVLIRQKKFAEAQSIVDQVDKANPKSPVPPLLRAQIQFFQNKIDASLPFFNQSLQRDPHFLPALYARAQISMARKKFADAYRDLKLIQAVNPKAPLAYIKLSELAALQKQPPQAIALLNQGIAAVPGDLTIRLVLAKYQMTQKKFADAMTTLQAARKIAPNDGQVMALIGQVQQMTGQKAAALGTNKALAEKYQQSGTAQALLANSMLANGDKKGAIAAFKRATELSPDVQQYTALLIGLQLSTGDKDGAVGSARTWAGNHKGPDGALVLASTLVAVNRAPEAASVVAKAQAVRPDYGLTIMEARIAAMRGEKAHALSVLKNWLSDHSTDLGVREIYGDMLLNTGDDAGALAQYEIFLKSRSDIPTVLNNAAWLLRDKNPGRALDLAAKAALLAPRSAEITDTYGWLLLQKKDVKNALTQLQRAHGISPNSGEITYHLAMAYNAAGNKAAAKQSLQDAIAKDGNFVDIADARKMLQKM